LKAIGEAFDAAWAEIFNNFGDDPVDLEKARLRLAKTLLSIAAHGTRLQARRCCESLVFFYSGCRISQSLMAPLWRTIDDHGQWQL